MSTPLKSHQLMLKVIIDDKEFEVQEGLTLIQACENNGIEIPRFCYHEKLKIAGNCRMCLVELKNSPKLIPSCAQNVVDGMVVYTNSPAVKKARNGIMEFLLINHPLDCPICDQGGECDLQDQAVRYGKVNSRFKEDKRAVEDKNFGPLIKTHMTRCIHCTRCVRFMEDIAGTSELCSIGRGEHMEIATYNDKILHSELSGNIIDLCPVGALTAKPSAFKARSWELNNVESIDIMDAVGSNISLCANTSEIIRILPSANEEINEDWISDKTRFFYDGLKYQRLDHPMIKNNKFKNLSWDDAIKLLSQKVNKVSPDLLGAIAGDLTDVETMLSAKLYLKSLGSGNFDCRQNNSSLGYEDKSTYIFNTGIKNIELSDHCLLIGCNPRYDATMINARIRKAYLQNSLDIALLGDKVELTYPYKHLGGNPWVLKQIADGIHPICSTLKASKKPMMILGEHITTNKDFEAISYYTKKIIKNYSYIQDNWHGYNILHTAASRVGGIEIGFIPENNGLSSKEILKKCKVIFLLGADELDFSAINKDAFVVYIGHHGDRGAEIADIVLPSPAFTEKQGTYLNLEGRIQNTYPVMPKLTKAQEEWSIFLKLAKYSKIVLPYKNFYELRQYTMSALHSKKKKLKSKISKKNSPNFSSDKIALQCYNYYLTNSICRNSLTMNMCSKNFKDSNNF